MSLAVLDWGIGGVPTWNAIREQAPNLDTIYISDSGYAPYGTVPAPQLADRLRRLSSALMKRGVTQVAVACNAASVALEQLHDPPCPIVGIIDDGVGIALASGAQTIAVLGGEGTIDARVHERRLRAAGRDVIALPAQTLSAHVEAGRLNGVVVERDVEALVVAAAKSDAILLACTHYPALTPVFRQFTEAPLLDPCEAFARRVCHAAVQNVGQGLHHALTSGDGERTRAAAKRAFGIDLGSVDTLALVL
ncbi:MAG: glutamate racemase [Polyangiales bacterium]